LAWTPDDENTVWAAVSRAVRTPSRTDNDLRVDTGGGPTPALVIRGSDDVVSETVLAYELGYRVKPSATLSLDVATSYNIYDDLTTTESTGDPGDRNSFIVYDNHMSGETYGVELAAHWNATEDWRLGAGYTFTQIQLHRDRPETEIRQEREEGNSPHNQFHLGSYLDLPQGLQFDTHLYYVDNLPALDIPAYFRLDARFGWHITDDLELSLVGQNLLDSHHLEFSNEMGAPDGNGEIERSYYVKLTYRF
jgi:iron complex outermembrane receptor protein